MREADLDEVLEIERASYRSPWQRPHFYHELAINAHAVNFVLRERGGVVGYASFWCLAPELTLNNLAVRADRRGAGLGRRLLDAVLAEGRRRGCRGATLEVRPSNAAALRLYGRFGFTAVGRRRAYYEPDGEDALILAAPLGAERP